MKLWKSIVEKLKKRWQWVALMAIFLVLMAFWVLGFKTEIRLVLEGYSSRTLKIYCGLTLLMLLLTFGLGVHFIIKKPIKLEKLFLVCALVSGFAWMCILPPLSAPDEIVHYSTAYSWSNRMLFEEAVDENGMVRMRAEDAGAPYAELTAYAKENYRVFYDRLFQSCERPQMVSFGYKPMKTGPIPYLPQALGITVGRLLHLGWAGTMFCGRLGNLLFFVICIYQAIKRTPLGKMIFFIAAMLPMTLELASSVSYDVVPLSLAFLFTAVCFYDAFVRDKMQKRDVAVLAVLLMALVPCKIVYFLLAGLCLLIPKEKFGSRRYYIYSAAAVLFLAILSLMANNMATLSEYAGSGENYIAWADAPGYTLKQLFTKPMQFLYLFVNTIRTQTGYFWETMIGEKLGALNISIGGFYVVSFTLLLFLAALREEDGILLTIGKRVWCLMLCAGVFSLVLLSMLLGWTPIGQLYIRGVQGRYFLPILPLFLLSFRNRSLKIGGSAVREGSLDRGMIFAAVLLNTLVLQRAAAVMLAGGI